VSMLTGIIGFAFDTRSPVRPFPHPKAMCHGPKLENKRTGAKIGICVVDEDFRSSNLMKMGPTGYDSPPEPVRVGTHIFYCYGPGGGGVSYPDGYFYNLRGKILVIYFDGPYENDKTPTAAAKTMEKKVLGTFREF